jgi:hypothetical protein
VRRFRPVLLSFLAVGLLAPVAPVLGGCDESLVRAMEKPVEKRLAALQKAERRCPEHAPTLASLGFVYLDMRQAAAEDWVAQALERFERALELEPSQGDSRWGAAMILEYAGAYAGAAEQYAWLANGPESESASEEARWAARVHLAASRFLQSVAAAGQTGAAENATERSLDLSEKGIRERAGWEDLQKVAAAVGMAGGLGALGEDYLQVDRALGLLEDWRRHPSRDPVVRRAAILAGMVDTLAGISARHDLGERVAASLATFGPGEIGPWPEPGFSGEMADTFRAEDRDPDRSFLIFPNLTTQERWNVPDLSGEWIYRQMVGSCTESVVGSVAASSREVTLEQEGKTATFGTPPFRCSMTRDHMVCGRMEPRRQLATQIRLECPIARGAELVECELEVTGTIAQADPLANPLTTSRALIGEYTCTGEATLRRVTTEPEPPAE